MKARIKNNIVVEIENKILTVIAERGEENIDEEKKGDWTLRKVERFSGRQTRSLAIPDNVDDDMIKTSYHEGVLNIHLQKKKDDLNHTSNKKKIEVK
jgi:HSP20 family molecular chaperone IbpA